MLTIVLTIQIYLNDPSLFAPLFLLLLLLYSLIDIVCLWLLVIIWVGWIPRLLSRFFFPAICKAWWDMTNAVLCLKDCSVCCKCTLGRGEVNYFGLNSYFVTSPGIQLAGRRGNGWVLNWPWIQVAVEEQQLFNTSSLLCLHDTYTASTVFKDKSSLMTDCLCGLDAFLSP